MALVLIVDDDEMSQTLLEVILQRAGHHVVKAYDGANALDLAYSFRPNLAIVDDSMPRMTGIEFTRRLKQHPELHDIPVIITSATMIIDGGSALMEQSGANAVLPKPWIKSDLENIVTQFISGKT
jgi:two-component system cell cycle response regulator DivK